MGRARFALPGTMIDVSQLDPVAREQLEMLDAKERTWLEDRLREYRELLAYLHDH